MGIYWQFLFSNFLKVIWRSRFLSTDYALVLVLESARVPYFKCISWQKFLIIPDPNPVEANLARNMTANHKDVRI